MLQLDTVTLRLGKQSFGPFSLELKAGERLAILGPSGAGKSTLLKLMSREAKPASGSILFQNQPLNDWTLPGLSQQRAVLPQSSDVAFGLPTELVISLGRVARDYDPQQRSIVTKAAELAHASHLLGRRFDTLSGGEQARVQLARVFAQLWDVQEGLILVDEPLASLDPGLQYDLLDSLEAYAAERGHALVAILHDINQAMLGFDRLLLIKGGRVVADLPSSAAALPALESLYGIPLGSVTNSQGDTVITPLRRPRVASTASPLP